MPTVDDPCDANVNVVCDFLPGDYFEAGNTMVTCVAIDSTGNADTCQFNVTIVDNTISGLACPSDINVYIDGRVIDGGNNVSAEYMNSCTEVQVFGYQRIR